MPPMVNASNLTRSFWELLYGKLGPSFVEDKSLHREILSLSRAFTEERHQLDADYFSDPKLQNAYLAYFVPLNFEKAYTLFGAHPQIWESVLDPADLKKPLHWVDFGSGPGTAVLAAMASIVRKFLKKEISPPQLKIDLIDSQPIALELAKELIEEYAKKLKLDVVVRCLEEMPKQADVKYDLALAANVLNELPPEEGVGAREALMKLWDATSCTLFILEPGHRVSSQRLVRFRERLLKDSPKANILGPCLHSEKCPVHRTKHWCHFSEPVTDGRLIDLNLRIFKDPRSWLKFSYFVVSRKPNLYQKEPDREWTTYRAIGDLHQHGAKNLAIDLCQPKEKLPLVVPHNVPPYMRQTLVRGSVVKVDKKNQIIARPMTKRELTE
jgi:ribosomal protein RSM22 (predicted rRNA methylase)